MQIDPRIHTGGLEIDHATDPVQSDGAVDDPMALAAAWLPGPDEDRLLMQVATIDPEGFPRARTVMLSEFDGERFYFHTDAASRKVAELTANGRVSLVVLWPGFTRQLVVQGTASVAPAAEIADAYARRSPYLQQLAWQNTVGFAQLPLAERRREWIAERERAEAATAAGEPGFAQAPGWIGFGVVPHRMLFWVSNPDAASRRVEYVRGDNGWVREYLAG